MQRVFLDDGDINSCFNCDISKDRILEGIISVVSGMDKYERGELLFSALQKKQFGLVFAINKLKPSLFTKDLIQETFWGIVLEKRYDLELLSFVNAWGKPTLDKNYNCGEWYDEKIKITDIVLAQGRTDIVEYLLSRGAHFSKVRTGSNPYCEIIGRQSDEAVIEACFDVLYSQSIRPDMDALMFAIGYDREWSWQTLYLHGIREPVLQRVITWIVQYGDQSIKSDDYSPCESLLEDLAYNLVKTPNSNKESKLYLAIIDSILRAGVSPDCMGDFPNEGGPNAKLLGDLLGKY
ncbi:hypothetical protein IKF87_00375 [Candidatus Saccharibacteria bacterium]|nr:hypothetical protein [Candidatus Saccharibacteria bacterium]